MKERWHTLLICRGRSHNPSLFQPTIANLDLTMEFNKQFSLPVVLGIETSAAEDEIHWMLPLQSESFRRFAVWSESS